jgi:Asp-tRNA(Asn)/Glu-tRNA(Gln) amidotransferase A subunit family amidase
VSGLRPTFGRVPRTGCMALTWSMDKIGTIARNVQDCGIVLGAINGFDPKDAGSVDRPFHWSMRQDARGLRVGFVPAWFEGEAGAKYRPVLDALRDAGATLLEVAPPKVDAGPLTLPIVAEGAAAGVVHPRDRTGAGLAPAAPRDGNNARMVHAVRRRGEPAVCRRSSVAHQLLRPALRSGSLRLRRPEDAPDGHGDVTTFRRRHRAPRRRRHRGASGTMGPVPSGVIGTAPRTHLP